MADIEDKLFANRYQPYHKTHLVIKDGEQCQRCDGLCEKICPAHVYRWNGAEMAMDHEGCLECGSCRLVCPYANIEWKVPIGGYGIVYKYG